MAFTSTNYIPTIWSPLVQGALYANTCLSQIANTNWEGEIKNYGDTVKIRLIPHLTIRDYDPDVDLTAEDPTKSLVELLIDKGKYYNFNAEYVEVKQSDIPFIKKFADGAGIDMKVAIEKAIFADIYTDADADNAGATAGAINGNINLGTAAAPVSITAANVVEKVTDLSLVLDEQNLPMMDRWGLLPAWVHRLLTQSDAFEANTSGNSKSALLMGKIGEFSNLNLYNSNTLHTADTAASGDGTAQQFDIIAGHKSALTFASQLLISSEKIKAEKRFKDYYRGLHVYGYEVVRPVGLVHAVWKKG